MKYFQFSFKSKSTERLNNLVWAVSNLLVPYLFLLPIVLFSMVVGINGQSWYSKFIVVCIIICVISGILLFIYFFVSIKGVLLFNDYIEIDRQHIDKWHLFKMNYKILYKDIYKYELVTADNFNRNDIYYHSFGGDVKEYIKITTKSNKIFCFAVENQVQFCEEVRMHLKEITNDASENES